MSIELVRKVLGLSCRSHFRQVAACTFAVLLVVSCAALPEVVEIEDDPAITPTAAAKATAVPTQPTPALTFTDGTWKVGDDIQPGLYQVKGASGCMWERLSGFSGEYGDTIAFSLLRSGSIYVEISESDVGFKSSRCGTWTRVEESSSTGAVPQNTFSDGIWRVGYDILPGLYQVTDASGCMWERLSGFSGEYGDTIAFSLLRSGSIYVEISESDVGFKSSRCGTWTQVE